MNANNNNTNNHFQHLLTCPVCMENLQAPCYQCENGHLICINCLDYLVERPLKRERICPECRIPLSKKYIRSIVADSLISSASALIKQDDHGCCGFNSFGNKNIIASNSFEEHSLYEVIEIRHMNQQLSLSSHESIFLQQGGSSSSPSLRNKGLISVLEINSDQKSLDPLPPGIYRINIEGTEVTKYIQCNSKVVTSLIAGYHIEVLEVSYIPKDKCVRGYISFNNGAIGGGWITLFDLTNGCKWADPMHLGVYQTIVPKLAVYNNMSTTTNEQQISKNNINNAVLKQGTYIEIIQVKKSKKDNCIRGEILLNGDSSINKGWITLVDEKGLVTAEMLPLGLYKTTSTTRNDDIVIVFDDNNFKSANIMNILEYGTNIDIVEISMMMMMNPSNSNDYDEAENDNDNYVIGRLTCGGWIPLVDINTGYKCAEAVLCF